MIRLLISCLWLSVIGSSVHSFAQDERVEALLEQFYEHEYSDWELAKAYLDSADAEASLQNSQMTLGRLSLYKGWYFQDIAEFDSCRHYFFQALEHYQKANSYNDIADVYGNLGNAYVDIEDYSTALDYQMKSLDLNEKILLLSKNEEQMSEAEKGRAYAWTNISSIFFNIGEYEKSLDYQKKGLYYEMEKGDTLGMGISYVGMSSVFDDLGHVDSSIYYGHLAEKIFIEYDYSTGLMNTYINLYNYYRLNNELKIDFLHKAYNIAVEFNDPYGKATSLGALVGSDYPFPKDSMENMIAEMKHLINEYDFEDFMFRFYKSEAIYLNLEGRHKEAYDALFKFTELNKAHKEKNEQVDYKSAEVKQQLQLQLFTDSLKYQQTIQEQQLTNEKRVNRQRIFITVVAFGALILGVFLIFVYRSLKVKKRNNEALSEKNHLIEKQKEIVEEKNKEITDSITYAKRLQSAILPPIEQLSEFFSDSMVLYLPKDVVSGDFYWFEKKNGKVFFAAADCTGHGVPGAMVSVVCSNALNRCVNEFGLTEPNEILGRTRELVIQTFSKSGENVKDGMDISLCALDVDSGELTYSGANNPLWILRNGANEMEEFKPNKQPIGLHEEMKPFDLNQTKMEKGDICYLFTDGFADQFGGEKGKKLKYNPFKELLIKSSKQIGSEQKRELHQFFEDWRADYDQIDDVCVLSVRM